MTPLVGITTYRARAQWSYWELEAALIPASYIDAVDDAGGCPVLVPPPLASSASVVLEALDGVIFSGGSDIDPSLYDAPAHQRTAGVHRQRDDADLALLRGALDRDMPVLGICRGLQVINVGLGGDLHQHVPDVVGHPGHSSDPPGGFVEHDVVVEPGTQLAHVIGEHAVVPSHHHQSPSRLGTGLVVAARARDGLVEAVEAPDRRFAIGVQWHPEEGSDPAIFIALVEAARAYAVEKHSRGLSAAAG